MRLKPYPEYKDSGVPWLGKVPEHWEVRRIKHVCLFAYGDSLPDGARIAGEVPVYGSNGQVGTHCTANTWGPCVVIGRKGSFGKVNYSQEPVFAIDTTFFVDKRFTSSDLRWLFYVLTWARLDTVTKDAAVPGLDRTEAYAQFVPCCPAHEQQHIAASLDCRLAGINSAISKASQGIDLIREYWPRLKSWTAGMKE